MNLKLRKQPFSFLKRKKENGVAGTLLTICAVMSLAPAALHLLNGLNSLSFSIFTLDEYASSLMLSILMSLPSLILFSTAYLLFEGHSFGSRLSIVTCIAAVLMLIANSGFVYFALPIALLSGLATVITIRTEKKSEGQNRNPIIMENVIKFGLRLSAVICISLVVGMIGFIIALGTPFLSLRFFTSMNLNLANLHRICWGLPPIGSTGGILSCTIGSVLVVAFCELIAVPIGVGAAIYLAEYSSQNSLISGLRFFIEILAGAPSVIIAIIGFTIFTQTIHWYFSLYSGAVALAFMALPWNIRVAEEAIKAVPRSYREASFALGATQWQTARKVTLYAAIPGIITGILLGIGVALGETLVLLLNVSGGTLSGLPSPWWRIFSVNQQLPTLTVFIQQTPGNSFIMGTNPGKGIQTHTVFLSYSLAAAAATVLIIIYLILCVGALLLRNYLNKRMRGA